MSGMTEFNAVLAVAGGVVLVLGITAGYVRNRLWVAETALCMAVGILVGPAVTGLISPAELGWTPAPHLQEVARLTLGLAVMGAALRLPPGYMRRNWRDVTVSLGLGLPLMWLTGAALAALLLGLPVLPALVLGAVLGPTDPVVAGSIASGQLAERNLSKPLRNLLTAESGANDGLGLLFVLLPVLLLQHPPAAALTEWGLRVLIWEILGAVVIGALVGELSGRLLVWAYRQPFTERQSTITVGLALSLTVLATVHLIGSDGILAVFVAGLMLNRYVEKHETRHGGMQEAISRFFNLPVFILLGAMLPWADWARFGWSGIGFVLAVLALRRLPWWLLLGRWLRATRSAGEVAFLGWFGPIGVSSAYYAILAEERTGISQIWPAASLVVFSSVVAHGISATPLTRLSGSGRGSGGDTGPARRARPRP